MTKLGYILLALFCVEMPSHGQLAVRVSPPTVTGQKAVVPLALRNGLSESVQSAKAVVFLVDEQGKMVAQSTRWIIDGEANKVGLAAGATNAFHFVIASDKPFLTTNLTAKVTVSRVVLEGGKLADVTKDVRVERSGK